MLKEKIMLANREIERVYDYIEDNYEMFDMMDLKLHKAYHYSYTELEEDFPILGAESDDLFYKFARISYEDFVQNLYEIKGIEFEDIRDRIGNSSSFYLRDYNIDFSNKSIGLIIDILYNYYGSTLIEDYVIKTPDACYLYEIDLCDIDVEYKEQELTSFEQELDHIIDIMYEDFKRTIEDIEYTYEYIRKFKDNQIMEFRYYLEMEEEEAIYKANETREKLSNRRKRARDIKFKYDISSEDIKVLQDTIGALDYKGV